MRSLPCYLEYNSKQCQFLEFEHRLHKMEHQLKDQNIYKENEQNPGYIQQETNETAKESRIQF